MQTNHFANPGASLTASVAIIPWVRGSFPGFVIGLWHGRRLYRFATYTGACIEHLDVTDQQVNWTFRDTKHRLEMLAYRSQGGLLRAPSTVEMRRRVAETLTATVEVRLTVFEGSAERLLFDGRGRHAGLQIGGDLQRLLDIWEACR